MRLPTSGPFVPYVLRGPRHDAVHRISAQVDVHEKELLAGEAVNNPCPSPGQERLRQHDPVTSLLIGLEQVAFIGPGAGRWDSAYF